MASCKLVLPVEALQDLQHQQGVLDLGRCMEGVGESREEQLSQRGVLEGVTAVGGWGPQGQLS